MEMNATTFIDRPVETVFGYVRDVTNDVHWRNGITESGLRSGPPLAPGSVGYARAGNTETEYRVVSCIPGESIDWELVKGPFKGRGGYRFDRIGKGTRFTLVADVEPPGVLRLLGPVFAWMGRRRNRADVESLREILESAQG